MRDSVGTRAVRKVFWAPWVLGALTSCAPVAPLLEESQTYSMDGVKLITPSITRGDDASAFSQASYSIGNDRRLLVRFESMSTHVAQIRTDEGRKVRLQVTGVDRGGLTEDELSIRACPVTRNWMMLATWESAFPLSGLGTWTAPGGDFDAAGCVSGALADPTKSHIEFDVTPWFSDYVRGRGSNFGLILIADRAVEILGENAGGESPRVLWVSR